MDGWVKNADLWLSTGAGLYWASYAFSIMNASPVYVRTVGANSAVIEDVFMLLWVIATYLICRRWGIRRARTTVAAAMIAASGVVLVCDVMQPLLPMGVALVVMCLDFFTLGASMVFWGLAFASLEKHLAAHNVVVAVLFATGLILLGQLVASTLPVSWLTDLCRMGSSAIMLNGHITLRNHARPPQPRPRLPIFGLTVQRLVYGFSLGFFPAAAGSLATFGYNRVLFLFAFIILIAAVAITMRADMPSYTILPVLILAACCALHIPFTGGNNSTELFSLISGTWLAWQTLSSVQLSDLKERYGFDELSISLVDKVAIAVTILFGAATCRALELVTGLVPPLPLQVVSTLLVIAFYALVLTSTFCLARLVGVQTASIVRSQVEQANAEHEEHLLENISDEFGLSLRERQVFKMLSQGYTSAFIAAEIGVTSGTVKAHTAHVYQKLGVHRKDEMLELVERYSEGALAAGTNENPK